MLTHEFDSSQTCTWCGIAAEQAVPNATCPTRFRVDATAPSLLITCPGMKEELPIDGRPLTGWQSQEIIHKCPCCQHIADIWTRSWPDRLQYRCLECGGGFWRLKDER